ncbi:hypothetical protein [Nocardioides sp.]|uniref:hypothetical protein n=1 Tax=Nocardioides sp. TaxID=35761 RepID=UPI002735CF5C|nr:hypothetical protein [Nocardioides sp.]MDP3891450.1 hypothetical protein [Nocardioides sp.]
MSFSTLLRGAAVGVTLTALLVPSTAHAGKSVHRDAVGDVVSLTAEADNEQFTPAPKAKRGDITRSVARHRAKRVTFKVRMREMPRRLHLTNFHTRVVTDKREYGIDVYNLPGPASEPMLAVRDGGVVECKGLTYERNHKLRFVRLSVPRACIGGPRWVRLGASVFHLADGRPLFLDESHRDGIDDSHSIAVGPKVRR